MNEHVLNLAEFPRPDMAREPFLLLDGEWDFSFDRLGVGEKEEWFRNRKFRKKIRVPFCVESAASGIGDTSPPRWMWYQRTFDPGELLIPGRRVLLHFGASDYITRVWLNGEFVGEHEGGYTPFRFDITDRLAPGENTLTVRVHDTLDPRIPRGKQSALGRAMGIFYTTTSGIWQSVWIESAGAAYVDRYTVTADPEKSSAGIVCQVGGDAGTYRVRVETTDPGGGVSSAETILMKTPGEALAALELPIANPAPWSPDSPNLYGLAVTVLSETGVILDRIRGAFGFRSIRIEDGKILLNEKPLFQKLLLCQGYFPEGHYTPVEWDLFRRDAELVRAMGFNGVRMHQKIENPKFLFWCDVLGCIVWEEMPSAYVWSATMRRTVDAQWREAVARDRNHPCILTWVPFNESWGFVFMLGSRRVREYVETMYHTTKQLDPTRLVVDNSGFEHVKTDIVDLHHYLGDTETCREYYARLHTPEKLEFSYGNYIGRLNVPKTPASPLAPGVKYGGEPLFISEYGGFGFYKTSEKPLLDNFRDYTLDIARDSLFQGLAYTQFSDTEKEANGLVALDRSPKIPIEEIRAVTAEVDRLTAERGG